MSRPSSGWATKQFLQSDSIARAKQGMADLRQQLCPKKLPGPEDDPARCKSPEFFNVPMDQWVWDKRGTLSIADGPTTASTAAAPAPPVPAPAVAAPKDQGGRGAGVEETKRSGSMPLAPAEVLAAPSAPEVSRSISMKAWLVKSNCRWMLLYLMTCVLYTG